jgi:hypothetical protein
MIHKLTNGPPATVPSRLINTFLTTSKFPNLMEGITYDSCNLKKVWEVVIQALHRSVDLEEAGYFTSID